MRERREQQTSPPRPSSHRGHGGDDPSGTKYHEKSFRGNNKMMRREPSGLRVSEIMETRQDVNSNGNGGANDAMVSYSYPREEYREDANANAGDDANYNYDNGCASSREEESWEKMSISTSISNNRSISSKITSVSNTRSSTKSGKWHSHSVGTSSVTSHSEMIPANIQKKTSCGRSNSGRSKSDCCNASRMTGATPRISNLNVRTQHHEMMVPLPEDDHHEGQNHYTEEHYTEMEHQENKHHQHQQLHGRKVRSKDNRESKEDRRRPPPMPSTTPKSHVAIDDEGHNNIEAATNNNTKSIADTNTIDSKQQKRGFKSKFLRRNNTNVSSITGWTKEVERPNDEVDYGIDPSRGSFDLVIVPKRSTGSGGSGRSGGSGKDKKRNQKSKSNKKTHSITAIEAASVASSTVKSQQSSIPTSNLTYWSSLSVKAAMAVMQAKGSEVMAQKAANTVLEAGKKSNGHGHRGNNKQHAMPDLKGLATKVSVVILESGGDHKVAAAVAVAIMNEDVSAASHKGKMNKASRDAVNQECGASDASSIPLRKVASITVMRSASSRSSRSKPINDKWLVNGEGSDNNNNNNNNNGQSSSLALSSINMPSETTSMRSKRHHLDEREAEIEEKERKIQEKMMALDTAANNASKPKLDTAATAEKHATEERAKAGKKERAVREAADKRTALEEQKRNERHEMKLKELALQSKELEDQKHKDPNNKRHDKTRALEQRARAVAQSNYNLQEGNNTVAGQDNTDIQSVTASMASKRRHLEQKEAEIIRQNKALERAARLNLQKEAEIQQRMVALDAATKTVESRVKQRRAAAAGQQHQLHQQQLQQQQEEDSRNKRRALKEKEDAIMKQNAELEKASRLNFEKEREIRERMAALDAATAALIERAENVQQEIDHRRISDADQGRDQRGSSGCGTLGRVDEDCEFHHDNQGGVMPRMNNEEFRQQQQHQHRDGYMAVNYGPGNNNGEFSVATPKTYETPSQQGEVRGQYPRGHPDLVSQNHPPSKAKSKGVFDQLTGKLYSMLDVACDSTAGWRSTKAALPEMGPMEGTGDDNNTAYSPRLASLIDDRSYYSNPNSAISPQLHPRHEEMEEMSGPRFKSPTLSGLTDDQRTWRWFDHQNDDNDNASQEMVQQGEHMNNGNNNTSFGVSQALNKALNHYMGQHVNEQQPPPPANVDGSMSSSQLLNSPNKLLDAALNRVMNQQNGNENSQSQPNNATNPNNPLAANQALNQALNQAMNQVSAQGMTNLGNTTAQVTHKPIKRDGNHSRSKRPSHTAVVPKANNPKSSLTKLKSSLFSPFSKKASSSTPAGGKKKPGIKQANNKQVNRNKTSEQRMKSYDHLRMGGPAEGDASPRTHTNRMATNKNDKSNRVSSPKKPRSGTPESKNTKGQAFVFSRKRSKLLEI